MQDKTAHAIGWGVGGTVLTVAGGVGMFLTGPVGWVVGGIVFGVGSSTAISAVSQGIDSSQKEFSYKTLATDVAIGATVSVITCGIGATMGPTSSMAAKEAAKIAAKETAKVATKEAALIAAKESAKIAAKEAAKIGAKEAAKIAAKEAAKIAAKEAALIAAKEAAKIATQKAAIITAKEVTKIATKEAAKAAMNHVTKTVLVKGTIVAATSTIRSIVHSKGHPQAAEAESQINVMERRSEEVSSAANTNSSGASSEENVSLFCHAEEQDRFFLKFLHSEDVSGVTHNKKLASWTKAREIGICPPFKLSDNYQVQGPFDTEIGTDTQHCIEVAAGETLKEILERPQQNSLFLTNLRDQLRQIWTLLQENRLVHQMIDASNFMVIETKLYLIGNDHLREFGAPRTIEARPSALNGVRYSELHVRRNLEQCDQNTDKRGFTIVERMIQEKIKKSLNQQ